MNLIKEVRVSNVPFEAENVKISVGSSTISGLGCWEKLKELAGCVTNGSDTTIKMFQDDATRSYWIKVGERSNFGSSFEEALSKFELPIE